jgi:hypothetical protein
VLTHNNAHPNPPLASRKVATSLRNELGLVSMRRCAISGSSMNVELACAQEGLGREGSHTLLPYGVVPTLGPSTALDPCVRTSSYTQLSTMPLVALQPMVLVRRFWISRTPSYPEDSMPSYLSRQAGRHMGAQLVRDSER